MDTSQLHKYINIEEIEKKIFVYDNANKTQRALTIAESNTIQNIITLLIERYIQDINHYEMYMAPFEHEEGDEEFAALFDKDGDLSPNYKQYFVRMFKASLKSLIALLPD